MAKHQVFLVHGMGSFEKDWSLGIQRQLKEIYASYPKVKSFGLVDDIEFAEITYNDVFEKWRRQWKKDATDASKAATMLGIDTGLAQTLIDLGGAASGNSFFQTHILDVVMYRFIKPMSEEVCQSVHQQILSRLNSAPQNGIPPWSVIAHSLGTAVTNDTLHAMFSQPDADGKLLSNNYAPWYLFMVANVSKILWNKGGDFYSSKVHPHVKNTEGMCYKYCNFHHELDPFTLIDPFSPPDYWFPNNTNDLKFYIDVKIDKDDIKELNIHSLSHYLSHPSINAPIIRTLAQDWDGVIESADFSTAQRNWQKNKLIPAALQKAQADLAAYVLSAQSPWNDLVTKLKTYRDAVLTVGINPRDGESK